MHSLYQVRPQPETSCSAARCVRRYLSLCQLLAADPFSSPSHAATYVSFMLRLMILVQDRIRPSAFVHSAFTTCFLSRNHIPTRPQLQLSAAATKQALTKPFRKSPQLQSKLTHFPFINNHSNYPDNSVFAARKFAAMAEESTNTPKKEPTTSEAMFFFAIVKHTRNKADIDWHAVAAEQGFKNADVAKVSLSCFSAQCISC